MHDERDLTDDERLCALLDRYLEAMHRADAPSQSMLLEQHPELRELLGCLESLDRLAGESRQPPDFVPAETVMLGNGRSTRSADAEDEDALGREFGKYVLLREVGRGGMGVVFLAEQRDLGRRVALKMIRSQHLASNDEVRRFYAEARAAGGLRHPNIIGIHEVGEIDGQHYFTMDYVDGSCLSDLASDGPLDAERAAMLTASIARAVDFLHGHNIIHRDLKPSNILIDAAGMPYVTDFGLAKVFCEGSERTQTGTILGTPSYMAPEQAAGRPSAVSTRSDVYSLGAIFYELLTGRPPFRHDNPLDTLVDVIEGEPTLLRSLNRRVPRELELICLRCLEKAPERRYATAADLADDLDRYLRREEIAAKPSGLWPKLRRWARREPALVSRWGVLLVAGGIVQIRYLATGTDLPYHLQVMGVLGIWAMVALVFQKIMNRQALADPARFAWAAADALLLTILLCLVEGPLGPLVIGYPLLVVASGLFFRVRLVWFMTLACLLSYAGLVLVRTDQDEPQHYALIFAGTLAIVGFIVAYQVFRVRVLSRYYENRPLP